MAEQPEPTSIAFATYEDYWARRHEESLWTPWFHWALSLANLPPAAVLMLRPSQYPTARCGDVIVTVYPGFSHVFEREREAHRLVAGCEVPVPRMLGAGTFPRTGERSWHWLIEALAPGVPWSAAHQALSYRAARTAAAATGMALHRLHGIQHGHSSVLSNDWGNFDHLIRDEIDHLGHHDGRLHLLPQRLHTELHALARATGAHGDRSSSPALLHADVHADNVFLDPDTGGLTGLIDLNEAMVGDPWYDLADAVFRLLHGQEGLTQALMHGYGVHDLDQVSVAVKLLGWALVHDFDGLTATVRRRGLPSSIESVEQAALHLTGLGG